jgi:hypothetical protein
MVDPLKAFCMVLKMWRAPPEKWHGAKFSKDFVPFLDTTSSLWGWDFVKDFFQTSHSMRREADV